MAEKFYKISDKMLDELFKLIRLYRNAEVKAVKDDKENAVFHEVMVDKLDGMLERIAIITEEQSNEKD